ncbi:MAG: hypothetical protein NTY08_10620 [Proteobacteria bacterium]|nr:hypothetical protein [Pseudomonadota bacterium]
MWDGSGLCLFHKRLNRGRVMSFSHLSKENEITAQDFTLIIGGAKVTLNISLKSN